MKKISFNDSLGLTKAVLQKRKKNKCMPVKLTFHKDIYENRPRLLTPDEYKLFFDGNNLLNIELDGKSMRLPKSLQPMYKIGEVLAISEPLNNLGYDPESRKNGNTYGLKKSLGWNYKRYVCASQCKHHVLIESYSVKRLHDVSEEEILEGGVFLWKNAPDIPDDLEEKYLNWYCHEGSLMSYKTPKEAYESLINSVYGKKTWEQNPWVIIYSFSMGKLLTSKIS